MNPLEKIAPDFVFLNLFEIIRSISFDIHCIFKLILIRN